MRLVHSRSAVVLAAFMFTVGAFAGAAGAQLRPTLMEGDPFPDVPGADVLQIRGSAGNHAGDWAVRVYSDDGVDVVQHIWGSIGGAAPALLRTLGVVGDFEQRGFTSLTDPFGLADDGSLIYTARVNELLGPGVNLDSLWVDDSVVYVEGDAVSSQPGRLWLSASDPHATASGLPFWYGRTEDALSGDLTRSLYLGTDAQVLVTGGDVLPNLPRPLDPELPIVIRYAASAEAGHWMVEANMASYPDTVDTVLVMDGAGLLVGGALVREGDPVPASIGGLPGEVWDGFPVMACAEDGSYAFFNLAVGNTDMLIKNGAVLHRAGDLVDGVVLSGGATTLVMNEQGDMAYQYGSRLLVNEDVIAATGDPIDIDGDGEADPGWFLDQLHGSVLVLGDREPDGSMDVVFNAWVEHPVTSELLTTLFVLSYKDHFTDEGFGLAGVQGVPSLQGTGFLEGGDPITLTLQKGVPNGSATLFLGVAPLFAPLLGGTLVPVPTFTLAGFPLDANGNLVIASTWPDGVPGGVEVYLQFWMPDVAAVFGASASNGLSILTP